MVRPNESSEAGQIISVPWRWAGLWPALSARRIGGLNVTAFFTALGAFFVAFFKRRPFEFELRDIWPASLEAVGAVKKGWLIRRLEAFELFLNLRAKAVIAIIHAFKEDLVRRGIDGNKIHVVTNGADLSRFTARSKPPELVQRLGLTGKFVAGYVGMQGLAQGLETILDAARIIADAPGGEHIRNVLLGDGARKAQLRARAGEMKLQNVIFLDTVTKKQVADYWALLDVSIIHLKRDQLFKTVIPSKLFECMAMGIPVHHGVEGESSAIVEHSQCGVCFPPEDTKVRAHKLLSLARDPPLVAQLRQNALKSAPEYDRTILARRMLEDLRAVVGTR